VHADPIRIGQILENLLSNAIRYTDPGGRILVSMRREGASAVIEVHDTGIGILASELPHVFEMFTQVHDERMRSSGGLGIGLALVRKLVEAHGGTVAAHSEGLGEGATFRVALPLASDDGGDDGGDGDGDGDGDDDPDAGADGARPAP
jgi:signal transduction histidine kinase